MYWPPVVFKDLLRLLEAGPAVGFKDKIADGVTAERHRESWIVINFDGVDKLQKDPSTLE
jgi:hypothetical protein